MQTNQRSIFCFAFVTSQEMRYTQNIYIYKDSSDKSRQAGAGGGKYTYLRSLEMAFGAYLEFRYFVLDIYTG